jgi:hypothetical protein
VRASVEDVDRQLDLAIECKSLRRSFPLLVSRIPRSPAESFQDLIFSHDSSNNFRTLIGKPPAQIFRRELTRTVYSQGEPVGKSTAQVGRTEQGELSSSDSQVYDKWAQALASADALIPDAVYRHKRSQRSAFLSAVLPILVVSDQTLWAADYASDGQLVGAPRPIQSTTLFVGRVHRETDGLPITISHLHICTRSELPRLLHSLLPGQATWNQIFPEPPARTEGSGA